MGGMKFENRYCAALFLPTLLLMCTTLNFNLFLFKSSRMNQLCVKFDYYSM